MKIIQILPEFEEGGVERHVLWLSNELVNQGHEVLIVSAGGKLEKQLDQRVERWKLPVHRKNPFTALYSAMAISRTAKADHWDILHAHSRVPAWIAWWTSLMNGIPWIATAHSRYSVNMGIAPYGNASGVVCVSHTVEENINSFLPENRVVIRNGLPSSGVRWSGNSDDFKKLLFVGRISRIKGLRTVIEALNGINSIKWKLDVLGDGPQRKEIENLSKSLGLSERIVFHGFCERPENWMKECDLLVFPSENEGLGMVLMQAIQIGTPVLASKIPAVCEIVGANNSLLLPPGNIGAWGDALRSVLGGECDPPIFDSAFIPSTKDMAANILVFYRKLLD